MALFLVQDVAAELINSKSGRTTCQRKTRLWALKSLSEWEDWFNAHFQTRYFAKTFLFIYAQEKKMSQVDAHWN